MAIESYKSSDWNLKFLVHYKWRFKIRLGCAQYSSHLNYSQRRFAARTLVAKKVRCRCHNWWIDRTKISRIMKIKIKCLRTDEMIMYN